MNRFEEALAGYLGKDNLKKIQKYKVGIAGAGGLGSNCAFNLIRSGFKHFIIVDFDKIEYANLNRQFFFLDQVGTAKVTALRENLLKINPGADITARVEKITGANIEDLFQDCQIIVEAFDRVESKQLITENYLPSEKLLVAASGLAGWGNSDKITVREITPTFYLIGDGTSEAGKNCPPLSPRVNITAAKQADVILNWVLSH
ncbi:MAG: sulfur carrier protein ThiS adenylyltransferase ThiF [Peptococcaceae bacterium]